jgi:hypothetical protein
VAGVRADVPFSLDVVEIDGVPALEARHREHVPVVEIDGEQAFRWFVDPDALRERLLRPGPDAAGTM